jgi:hypothetical protein
MLDKAICKHIIAAALVDGVEFYGIKKNIESLRTLRRKRKLPELDESQIDEDVDEDVNEYDDEDDVRSDVVEDRDDLGPVLHC